MAQIVTEISTQNALALPLQKQAELRKMWTHAVTTDTNAIGWLPLAAYDQRFVNGEILTITRNNELVGWALIGKSQARAVLKIYQIWVRTDARIMEHGRALIWEIESHRHAASATYMEAWVADDLAANLFWRAIGFAATVWKWGRGKSSRKIIRYVQHIYKPQDLQNGRKHQ